MTLLAVLCVAATLATFSVAVVRRWRIHRDRRNGVRAFHGSFIVSVEAVRVVKQIVLVHCAVKAISEDVLLDVCIVCTLMALTSVAHLVHQRRLARMVDGEP